MKKFRLLCVCLLTALASFSQDEWATIRGTFTEKVNAEIDVIRNENGRLFTDAQYFKRAGDDRFFLSVKVTEGAKYTLYVKILKQGARREEVEKSVKDRGIEPMSKTAQMIHVCGRQKHGNDSYPLNCTRRSGQ